MAKGPKGSESSKKGGQPPGAEQSSGAAGDQRENRTQAGEDLQRAGEQIAKAGTEEVDPLIPETESDSADEGDVFSDSSSASNSDGDESSEAGAAGNNNGEQGDQVAQNGAAGGSGSDGNANSEAGDFEDGNTGGEQQGTQAGGISDELGEEIQRAREALAKAGGALQEAGAAVANAETDEELAAAEDLLSDARIAVIVASQDIEILEGEMQGTPGWGEDGDELFEETSAALQDANIALVIATRSILIARTGSPELPGGVPRGGILVEGDGEIAALEDELDESLIIFDGQIGEAREAVLSSAPPPETSTSSSGPRPDGEREDMMSMPPDPVSEEIAEEQQVASAKMPDMNDGDIPDAQGDDIVAQQLREAAMAESDPELQAKLWEEYKRYKEGL